MEEVAKEKNTFWPKCLGWSKQIFYIYSWIIIYLFAKDTESIGLLINFIITITALITIYLISNIFMFFFSKTFVLLSNINENNSINQIMNELFKEKPVVNITCSCYHYETRTYTTTDSNGYTTTQTSTVLVQTYVEMKQLNIFSYLDISGIFRLKETNKSFIRLEMGKEINFNDELTLLDVENIKNDLYVRNRFRDLYISISVNRIIPKMKDYYLVKLKKDENYCLIQKWVFILSGFLMVDQFYKFYLEYISTYQFFIIRKIISSRNNVLENNRYSEFTPGYTIENEKFVAKRDDIGGIDTELNLLLPTEEEIEKAKAFNKYIPEYKLNEYGDVININRNSIDNIINIQEKNEKENVEVKKIDDNVELNVKNNDSNSNDTTK